MKRTKTASLAGAGIVLAALAACGGAERAETTGRSMAAAAQPVTGRANAAPRVERVALSPSRPQAGTMLEARVEARDPDGDAVTLRYGWLVDGARVEARGATLLVPQLRKGAAIELEVVASDGRAESEPVRASARIANRAPVLSRVDLEPATGLKIGEEVVAVAEAGDPDGDLVRFHYDWRVNGKAVRGAGEARFATTGLKRGDRVDVRVLASDGEDETPPSDSRAVEIGNSAPQITSSPAGLSSEGVLRYTVAANDPDGDRALRFKLAAAPEGARIDPLSGELVWQARRDQVGAHPIEVVVEDGHGGEARQRFEVTLSESKPKRTAGQPPASAE